MNEMIKNWIKELMNESKGGMSVMNHILSPMSAGLFRSNICVFKITLSKFIKFTIMNIYIKIKNKKISF